jgi:tripartite-type tricarboxylate transporter receptor subunit TctC
MKFDKPWRRAAAVLAVATLLAACGDGAETPDATDDPTGEDQPDAASDEAPDAGDWPGNSVQFVIPTAAGGGLDTTFRQIQPFLEEELGVPVAVEYREGGQFAIGTTYVANEGADCEPFMFHAIPDIIFSYQTQDVAYTYESFYPLAGLTTEPSTLWVRNDAPWDTLDEFLDDARARPGEITVSVANLTNADHLAVLNLQEEADVEFNIISYDGGGPARNAIVAGEVDAGMGGVFAGQGIAEDARALTVFQDENEWPELTDDAPAVNDVVNADIPPIGGAFGFFAARDCYEDHPERFEILADAIAAAAASDGFQSRLDDIGELSKLRYETPEEFDAFIQREIDAIETLLEESPELFGL